MMELLFYRRGILDILHNRYYIMLHSSIKIIVIEYRINNFTDGRHKNMRNCMKMVTALGKLRSTGVEATKYDHTGLGATHRLFHN